MSSGSKSMSEADVSADRSFAIIGIGCRFPGRVDSVEAFWRVLTNKVDATSEIPENRWLNKRLFSHNPTVDPGSVGTRRGGFVHDISEFDAGFFGISPREAALMDPQQRILLEVAFNALENGGQTLETIGDDNVGVFIGISAFDYAEIQHSVYDRDRINGHTNTGIALSIAANRISFAFDLTGPSLAVDTACSSSLVAVHLACNSLASGECDLAIAGGVNAILKPEATIGFSSAAMLAPDGRCKAFDVEANGYGRGEGAGAIVLKPLQHALDDSDMIYAVVKGTAVNQDGHTSSLTTPNADGQAAMLRRAYQTAGVDPAEVQFIEAHGTGTPVGDPIEVRALASVLSDSRKKDNPCLIGSVKTNIGHLEAAAGIAGLIKASLSLHYGKIPANLNFSTGNPDLALEHNGFVVPTDNMAWPDYGRVRRAGVNSFGFGGTNAHVVLEEAPEAPEAPEAANCVQTKRTSAKSEGASTSPYLLPISARSEVALLESSRLYASTLRQSEGLADVGGICCNASLRRSHHRLRLAVIGDSSDKIVDGLNDFNGGKDRAGVIHGIGDGNTVDKPVFVFSGMGPQWWAMGTELLKNLPAFRGYLEDCDREFATHAGWSLLEELSRDEASSRMSQTEVSQPANFALQVALTRLWLSWGIEPSAIVGHSTGEVAAAYAAGVLDLENATRVIFHRSRLQQRATGRGAMAAVGISPEEANAAIGEHKDTVSVSAVNSPRSVTLSGNAKPLEQIVSALAKQGIFTRMLTVNVPYHSHHMDPLRDELLSSLDSLETRQPEVPLYSTVTGDLVEDFTYDAAYWWRNMRAPVLFASAIEQLIAGAHTTFLEVGPHPVLSSSVREVLTKSGTKGTVLSSLRRAEPERYALLSSLAQFYVNGHQINWKGIYPETCGPIPLPQYPWQRTNFWYESTAAKGQRLLESSHPLLGSKSDAPQPAWHCDLSLARHGYLKDHQVRGAVIFPAAGYIELALAAGREHFETSCLRLTDLTFDNALVLRTEQNVTAQLHLSARSGAVAIHSKSSENDTWLAHMQGRLQPCTSSNGRQFSIDDIAIRCAKDITRQCYAEFAASGLEYGPCFQGIEALWKGDAEAIAYLKAPAQLVSKNDTDTLENYIVHPSLLDSCFQAMIGTIIGANGDEQPTYLPIGMQELRVIGDPDNMATRCVYVRRTRSPGDTLIGDIFLLDSDGNTVVEMTGFVCKALRSGAKAHDLDNWLYRFSWELQPSKLDSEQPLSDVASPADLAAAVRPGLTDLAERLQRERYYREIEPLLDEMTAAYAWQAIAKIGGLSEMGERCNVIEFCERSGIAPNHQRLVERLFACLCDQGVVARTENGGFQLVEPYAGASAEILVNKCRSAFPEMEPELALIERCGSKLGDVLTGRADPVQVLFPNGSQSLTEPVYSASRSFGTYNEIVERLVRAQLNRLPEDRRLRILEIGSGTGALASRLLEHLPKDRTQYVYTDITPLFLKQAESKFKRYKFVEYRVLDIEKPPASQGFELNQFDLVIAGDVLHATRHIRTALAHAADLLAAGGLMLLLELTRPPYWFDLTFGQLKGWWAFEDEDIRPDHACIAQTGWTTLLAEAGMEDVNILTDRDTDPSHAVHSVFIASHSTMFGQTQDAATENGAWVLVMDRGDIGKTIHDHLSDRMYKSIPIVFDDLASDDPMPPDWQVVSPTDSEALRSFLSDVDATHGGLRGVVQLSGLDVPPIDASEPSKLFERIKAASFATLNLVKAMAAIDGTAQPHFVLLTQDVQIVEDTDEANGLAGASAWGLGRTIANEYPGMQVSMIDLSAAPIADDILGVVEGSILRKSQEAEIAWRNGERYVARLRQSDCQNLARRDARLRPVPEGEAFQLTTDAPGLLDNLVLKCSKRSEPGCDEVEIDVHAAGLNFRDLMKAMGTYPTDRDEDFHIGDECSGIVSQVGLDVEGFAPGDRVMAICRGFGSHVTVHEKFIGRLPVGMTFEDGATIPIVFQTAWHGLHDLARIAKGERILVHSAAGGVGVAAIQIAQNAGAEVFATVSSEEKRSYLESLGVKHIMNSRTLDFSDEVLEKTNWEGVDIVINSLAGEAIPASLAALGPFGRFLEIGKADIYQNTAVGLGPFRNCLSYHAIDMDRLFRHCPDQSARLMQTVLREFEEGRLKPLPSTAFALDQAEQAFRYMAQAKHIGKIVLDVANCDRRAVPHIRKSFPFRKDGTYLLTGGLGGIGLALAEWMAKNGAGHLILCGRKGITDPRVEAKLDAIRQAGSCVEALALDVTDGSAVKAALEKVRTSHLPLRGIVHLAMVLSDNLIEQQSPQSLASVLAPKVHGALNLHRYTATDELDLFVMFSSFAAVIGNPGQSNYCAANTFLSTLAEHRRARGLPGLAIDWGAFSDVGYVAEHDTINRHFERNGLTAFATEDALRILETALRHAPANLCAINMDWNTWSNFMPGSVRSSRFRHLVGETAVNGRADNTSDGFVARLNASPAAERLDVLETWLQSQLARTLACDPGEIDARRPLAEIGVDSLIAVELACLLEETLDIDMSSMELAQAQSIKHLCGRTLDLMDFDEVPDAQAGVALAISDDLAQREIRNDQ